MSVALLKNIQKIIEAIQCIDKRIDKVELLLQEHSLYFKEIERQREVISVLEQSVNKLLEENKKGQNHILEKVSLTTNGGTFLKVKKAVGEFCLVFVNGVLLPNEVVSVSEETTIQIDETVLGYTLKTEDDIYVFYIEKK